ncbi:hypothetical protein [Paenibacillus camelliae]|uniref:hypothetical protein n=1 Tax=Paenibacillus camelliae TaxID=512410 RepID=UPI00203D30F0|nr:hypothetical protein [Paenibacillus camelliae]MCM3634702.1 hypothetical protein [Paenibacillus camelliae]
MDQQRMDNLKAIVYELSHQVDEPVAAKLELERCHRIIEKLSSFAPVCEVCVQQLIELENHFVHRRDQLAQLSSADVSVHKQLIDSIKSHLMKQHKMVTSGLYLSIYMSLGTSLGVVFGLLVFDNIGLGLPLGIGVGVAIGAALDADAKKKDLVI